ncbi:MAG: LamG-like jellyroll fold domain-containing protein [Verrucomicrobiota bacterium]
MQLPTSSSRFRRIGVLLAGAFLAASSLLAQAQFAGTYIGTFNTRQSAGGITIEIPSTGYIATVTADGAINVNSGAMTGTVSASGAVTLTGGSSLATFGITSATIANNQLSSAYGASVANGVAQWRFNPSTTFTPAPGGGTGGGGTGGGGTTTGDLLAHYSFNDASNPLRDDSGRGFNLTAVNGVATRIDGRVGAGALRTTGVRLRTLVNSSFSTTATTVSLFVRPTAAGSWNPRLAAVGPAGTSSQFYGLYLDGASTGARRVLSLQDGNGSYPPSASSAGAVPTSISTWTHVALVHTGSEARIYINGNLSSATAGRRALGTFATAMLTVAGSDNGLDLFTGDLDEIRFYNRALTAAEVTTLSTGGSVGTATSGTNTAAAVAANVIAAPVNLTGYRSRVGQSVELIVTGSSSGAVWGTDVYTDDSTVARAAVHAGVVAVGETKTVTLTVLPGQASYIASTRNGVSTGSWGGWGGSYSFAGSSGAAVVAGTASVIPAIPASFRAPALNVVLGGRFSIPIPVTGTGPFTYQWFLNGTLIQGATANPYVVNSVTAATAGTYTVRVNGPAGNQTFTAGTLTVPATATAPQIVLQPFDKTVSPGGTFALAASAIGNGLTYQWLRNGTAISAAAGGTNSILLRQNADSTDAGTYTVRITGGGSTVTSTAAVVTIDPNASRLSNLSGRISIGGTDRVIPAFTISGSGKKRVLIRAIGPGLAAFGVGGTMADPKFELYDGSTKIAENNDWSASIASAFTAVGAFSLPASSRDAADIFELDAGKGYSIHVFSNTGAGGVVLFEVYDLGNVSGGSKFTNVSVRGPTGTGDATLILGLNISGVGKRTLLTRGIGPQLADFGVSGTIADPKLEIFDSNQRTVLENNDWSSADFVTEMLQAREFVGAFALNGGSADASTLALLDPGSYTMQITAATGTTSGEAIVEIYEVP